LPSMLNVASFNVNRGQKGLRIFEAGKIYRQEKEVETLGLAMLGTINHDWRRGKSEPVDFYDLKGTIEQVLKQIAGDKAVDFNSCDVEIFEKSSGAAIQLMQQDIGMLGKIQGSVLKNFNIKDAEVWFAQIDLEKVYAHKKARPKFRAISAYPAIMRDISLTFDKTITYKEIAKTIQATGSKNLIEISFKEDYTKIIADKIDAGHRGVLISLMYQSHERTLAEDEVNAEHQAILKSLVETFKVKIR